jgi:dihydrofolate reductase
MRAAIVAMSPARIIGRNGILPWHYPADMRRFKQRTLGATIIMGRRTWESIGCKSLPKRRNIVITGADLPHVETFLSIDEALLHCDDQVWFIGGAMLYEAALSYCDLVDITHVPDQVPLKTAVYFPELHPAEWRPGPVHPMAEDYRLKQQIYYRRTQLS